MSALAADSVTSPLRSRNEAEISFICRRKIVISFQQLDPRPCQLSLPSGKALGEGRENFLCVFLVL